MKMPSGGEMILKLDGARGASCRCGARYARRVIDVAVDTVPVVRRPHKLSHAELSEMLQGADAASLLGTPTGTSESR